ncbi:hypothetical protein EON66_04730 [archaeon]|nr:MAG: hypothetical protein EON66_04730 [archaeon]
MLSRAALACPTKLPTHTPHICARASVRMQGVNLLRFVLEDGVMGNASVNPLDAAAYNTFGPSGLLNQSQCEWGAPIFVSRPRYVMHAVRTHLQDRASDDVIACASRRSPRL